MPGWYYPVVGAVAGVAIVACAMLPSAVVGPSLVAAALVVGVLSFFSGGAAHRRRLPITTARALYLALVAVAVLGSLIVVWAVVRPSGDVWLAWVLAVIVFVVLSFGARVMRPGRSG